MVQRIQPTNEFQSIPLFKYLYLQSLFFSFLFGCNSKDNQQIKT